eukprot:3271697-Prorocentrum_lima.AAC.1
MPPHSEYVDDFVLRISAQSADHLQREFTAASAAVLRAHALVGLPVNVAPDKTAAIMSYHGPGASQARQDLVVVNTVDSSVHMALPAHTYQIP